MEKSYFFVFNGDCFDRDNQRGNISNTKKPFNKTVSQMNGAVEELDRYDDFDSLRIDSEKYARDAQSGEYGIPYDRSMHGRSVILSHQNIAAKQFLKELRGFGLLADVVGSGKTFEAAVILSELAVRGKIKSMLLVVPKQVYDSWINVLETQFGLGRDVLFEADAKIRRPEDLANAGVGFDAQNRPDRPLIVMDTDFANWDFDMAKNLFDVIVVDEAHHLCEENGAPARSMKLLSMMMETKKRANVTYCLLLSATPHSGNLANMFRLWYFVRCKGGYPADFDEKQDAARSDEYNSEKAYYHERICRGATTVMEFIKHVKKTEVMLNYSEEFGRYLLSHRCSMATFEALTAGEQQALVDEFLLDPDAREIGDAVMHEVANAYHGGVLRPIMVRQPPSVLISKEKRLVNYLIYPAKRLDGVKIKDWYGNALRVEIDRLHEDTGAVTPLDESGRACGDAVSLEEYVREHHRDLPAARFYADILGSIFAETADESKFTKKDFVLYYREQMMRSPDTYMRCLLRPTPTNADPFAVKLEEAKQILRRHSGERVLIFFDYELRKSELVYDRFLSEIQADPEFSDRLVGTAKDEKKVDAQFEAKSNAILVARNAEFTEGANLQSGSIIINFQVTPDPLAMDQRIGRIFRLGQKNNVTIYSLACMNQLEGFALMYFARIGLMSSNSGDATIIAGSNNDYMVAVQCERCGLVKLYSKEDYETHERNGDLYCIATAECINTERPSGTLMRQICVFDFKCDKCGTMLVRSAADESGYLCLSSSNTGRSVLCNRGDRGDRRLYCRKICAMSHCSRFRPGECPAVEAYLKNRGIGDQDLYAICSRCPNQARCPEKCRPRIGAEGITACSTCDWSTCSPRPYVIDFNEQWEANCPICRSQHGRLRGTLRPVAARTFAAYLRASWDFQHDEGRSFCGNLLKEANKVADIKLVLDATDGNE